MSKYPSRWKVDICFGVRPRGEHEGGGGVGEMREGVMMSFLMLEMCKM